jgi:hypothetical protein
MRVGSSGVRTAGAVVEQAIAVRVKFLILFTFYPPYYFVAAKFGTRGESLAMRKCTRARASVRPHRLARSSVIESMTSPHLQRVQAPAPEAVTMDPAAWTSLPKLESDSCQTKNKCLPFRNGMLSPLCVQALRRLLVGALDAHRYYGVNISAG